MQPPRRRLRRLSRALAALGAYVVLASFTSTHAGPEQARPVDALQRLKAGNDRFVQTVKGDAPAAPAAPVHIAVAPLAAVLSCADARVPPEVVFGAAPGELFVVRSLGQVVDRAVVGSLEHGVETLHVPALVVMGHDACSAVAAAVDAHTSALSAHLDYLLKAIRAGLPGSVSEQHDIRSAVLANVEQVINDLLGASPVLRDAVESGRLTVAGAYYEAATGEVVFSAPVGRLSRW